MSQKEDHSGITILIYTYNSEIKQQHNNVGLLYQFVLGVFENIICWIFVVTEESKTKEKLFVGLNCIWEHIGLVESWGLNVTMHLTTIATTIYKRKLQFDDYMV